MDRLPRGFYSRILLICIIIICTVSVLLAFIIGTVAARQERLEYLKKYDIAINDLHLRFMTRHRSFQNDFKPLFQSPAQYQDVCALLRGGEGVSSAVRSSVVDMLSAVSERDYGSVGILLHSDITGELYLYDARYKSMERIRMEEAFPSYASFTRGMISAAELDAIGVRLSGISAKVYGIVGTLPDYDVKGTTAIGRMAVLYPVTDFVDSLAGYHLDAGFVVSILDGAGRVVFRSSGDYADSADLYRPQGTLPESGYDTFRSQAGQWDAYAIGNKQYDFTVAYQVPAYRGSMSMLIFLLAMLICVIAIFAYGMALRSTAHKVRLIQHGMAKVSRNRLDYRIPEPKGRDEFVEIIRGFNSMCDQLGQTVEQLYIRELQKQKAELYAMQTSINPHFLYNTLELIRVQILHGSAADASRMILLLGKVYRSQINQRMNVTIAEELEHCENLILLHQYRFANFDYVVDIPDDLLMYGIPQNTLQPLIENYFVHGLNPQSEDNLLTLSGAMEVRGGTPMLVISIVDNGRSIAPEKLIATRQRLHASAFRQDTYEGFALYNVNLRLKIVFGEGAGLALDYAEDGKGFRIDAVLKPCSVETLNSSELAQQTMANGGAEA